MSAPLYSRNASSQRIATSRPYHYHYTTLPTSHEDTHAHTLLSQILVPNASQIHWLGPSLLLVCGLCRFGERQFGDYNCAPGAWERGWVMCEYCTVKCERGCKPWIVCMCKGDDEGGVVGLGR